MGLGRQLLEPGAQLLLQELLVRGSVAGGHGRRRLHQLVVAAKAGATAERRRRLELADHLGGELPGADALPAGLATGVTHGEVALPGLTADSVAENARSFQAVAAALGAIQRDLVVVPGDATGEARAQLGAQIFDREDGLGADFAGCGGETSRTGQRRTADQVRQGRGQTEASTTQRTTQFGQMWGLYAGNRHGGWQFVVMSPVEKVLFRVISSENHTPNLIVFFVFKVQLVDLSVQQRSTRCTSAICLVSLDF